MFAIDWDRQQVTCPQGVTSATWCEHVSSGGHDAIQVKFPQAACRACPARSQCTTSSKGRQLGLRPRPIHEAVHRRPRPTESGCRAIKFTGLTFKACAMAITQASEGPRSPRSRSDG